MAEIIDFHKIIKRKTTAKHGLEITILNTTATEDNFGYNEIMTKAMASAIREIIEKIADSGLPDTNHLYVKFSTNHNHIVMDDDLLEKYPETMTINLQHKFSELKILKDSFSIWLKFDGKNKRIIIPFDAIISVVDPSMPFGISMIQSH